MLPDEQLHWGFLEEEDFMYGPTSFNKKLDVSNGTQTNRNLDKQRQIALNVSQTIDANSTVVAITDKLVPELHSLNSSMVNSRAPPKQ